jgi:hypothetical protein
MSLKSFYVFEKYFHVSTLKRGVHFFVVLEIEPRAWCMLGKHSTAELHLQSSFFIFISLLLCWVGMHCGITKILVMYQIYHA